ncbi:MAG: lamin tail domain-containing protein [Anaerolineales bacterium]
MAQSRWGVVVVLVSLAASLACLALSLPGTSVARAGDLTLVAPPPATETPLPEETPPCPETPTPEVEATATEMPEPTDTETSAPLTETPTAPVTDTPTPANSEAVRSSETPSVSPPTNIPTLELEPTPSPTATESPDPTETPSATAAATATATATPSPIIFIGPPPAPATATPTAPLAAPQILPQLSTTLLISQVYGGGGNSGAPFRNDFIELYNAGTLAVDLSGWSVQYASASGSAWSVTPLTGTIPPGRFWLIVEAGGVSGLPLPSADVTGTINLAATAGKVAVINTLTPLSGTCPLTGTMDFIGYGTTASCAETAPVGNLSNTTSAQRTPLRDTDNNGVDFIIAAPLPRNSAFDPLATPTPTRSPTATQPPTLLILINEVAWAGTTASSSDEWMELHNPGVTDVSLAGWTLSDGGDIALTFPTGPIIPAGGYLLLERTDDDTVSDITADVIYTGGLNNEGETLALRDSFGALMDTANADGGGWPAGDDGAYASMERVGTGTESWRTHSGAQNGRDADGNPIRGTPRNLNSLYLPTPTPPPLDYSVLLNEFLPAPTDGASEFIELINTAAVAKDVSDWKIDDGEGGSSPVTLPAGTVLQPGEIRAFDYSGLNNDGDTARLLEPLGFVVDEWSYARDPGDNVSVARLPDGGAWSECGLPTPGQPNLPTSCGTATEKALRADAVPIGVFRTWPAGAWATLTGRVTLPAPLFGRRLIYIQDETGGIAVYLGRGDWPALLPGQAVTVLGYSRIRSTGRLEIYVRNPYLVSVAPPDGVVIPARAITHVDAILAGQLVTLTGVVTRLESTAFWLDAGAGPVRIFFTSTTGARRPRALRGEMWAVTGIVTELTATTTRAAGWQIQPRFASDVQPPSAQPTAPPASTSVPLEPTPTEEPTATPGP